MARKKAIKSEEIPNVRPEFTYNNVILAKALKDRNFDVLDNIINLYNNSLELKDKDKISILEKLLPFLIPKLATTEIKGDGIDKPSIIQIIYKDESIKTLEND